MLFPLFYTLTEVSGIGLNVVRSTWLITAINIVAFIANTALLYLLCRNSVQKCGYGQRNGFLAVFHL